jgi:nicotinamide phosphoribosyltransferase
LEAKGFASTNIVLGIGSYTYQYNTRDTQGWAMKATYGEIFDPFVTGEMKTVGREIYKDPITDSGEKKSAKGLIAVYRIPHGEYYMKDQVKWENVKNCAFEQVFVDGKIVREEKLADIRARVLG